MESFDEFWDFGERIIGFGHIGIFERQDSENTKCSKENLGWFWNHGSYKEQSLRETVDEN